MGRARPPSLVPCLVVAVAIAGACRPQGDELPPDARIVHVTRANEARSWELVHEGVDEGARQAGFETRIVQVQSAEELSGVVDRFAGEPATGVITPPLEPEEALSRALERARDRGLAVIVVGDFRIRDAALATVGPSPARAGRLAASHLAELLDGTGRIVAVAAEPDSPEVEDRFAGARDELGGLPGIELEMERFPVRMEREDFARAQERLLASEADAVLALDDGAAEAALRVVRKQDGWNPRIVSIASKEELRGAVVRRHMDGLVRGYPHFTGDRAARLMAEHLTGGDVPRYVDTGVHLTTQGDEDMVAVPPTEMPAFEGR